MGMCVAPHASTSWLRCQEAKHREGNRALPSKRQRVTNPSSLPSYGDRSDGANVVMGKEKKASAISKTLPFRFAIVTFNDLKANCLNEYQQL